MWRGGRVLVNSVRLNKFECVVFSCASKTCNPRSSLTQDPGIAHEHGRTLPSPEHPPADRPMAHFGTWTTALSGRLQEQIQGPLDLVLREFRAVFNRQVLEQARGSRADEREGGHEETPVPEHFGSPHGLLGARPREDTNDRCSR